MSRLRDACGSVLGLAGRWPFCFFFVTQACSYGLMCWNYRAVAQVRYVHIGVSDAAIAALQFNVIRKVGEATAGRALAGYVLGGTAGSLASTWVTTIVFGQ